MAFFTKNFVHLKVFMYFCHIKTEEIAKIYTENLLK